MSTPMIMLSALALVAASPAAGSADEGPAPGEASPAGQSSRYLSSAADWKRADLSGPSLLDPRKTPVAERRGASSRADAEAECAERVPHPPIRIAEDEGPLGFILGHEPATGDPIYRPGSGVVAGTGTEDDPYVIEGWCIRRQPTPWLHWMYDPVGAKDVSDHVTQSIMIDSTGSHVVVRDNVLPGTLNLWEVGILLEDARNVTVAANHVSTMWHGIFLWRSHDSVIRDNTLVDSGLWGIVLWSSNNNLIEHNLTTESPGYGGILVSASDGALVRRNQVTDNGGEGIFVSGSAAARVEENFMSGNARAGLIVRESDQIVVRDNLIVDCGLGMALVGATDSVARSNVTTDAEVNGIEVVASWNTLVHGNRTEGNLWNGIVVSFSFHTEVGDNVVLGNTERGIVLERSLANAVRGNAVRDNDLVGVLVEGSELSDVLENEITGNHDGGVRVVESEASEIHLNEITGNAPAGAVGVGIAASDSTPVEAADNWWGCPGGPGSPGCDFIEGGVTYEPWLTQARG